MSVSFIHMGDTHFGKNFRFGNKSDVYGKDKRADIWLTFEKIIATAEKNRIDLLLVAGDLFDSQEADIDDILRVSRAFRSLTHTQVIIIGGNHDYYNERTLYALVQWPDNVVILKTGEMEAIWFPELNVQVYGMSWIRNTYREPPFNTNITLDPNITNILLLHGDAINQTSEYMPLDLSQWQDFDYIALGHVHQHQFLGENAAYCGSPEALDFGEEGDHGIVVGQFKDSGCEKTFIQTQHRHYVNAQLNLMSDMSEGQIKEKILNLDTDENRMNNYYRVQIDGYLDPTIDFEAIKRELERSFYYLEILDEGLDIDLDIDLLYAENKDNIVGTYIEKIRERDDTSVSRKAMIFGLSELLKEKVLL